MIHCKHQTRNVRKPTAGSPADSVTTGSLNVTQRCPTSGSHTIHRGPLQVLKIQGDFCPCVCVYMCSAVSHTDTHSSPSALNNRDSVFNRSGSAVLERKVCPAGIIDSFQGCKRNNHLEVQNDSSCCKVHPRNICSPLQSEKNNHATKPETSKAF